MTPDTIFRDAKARHDALLAYARLHDHFAEDEQRLAGQGRAYEAEGAHEYALTVLRAYRAELDDPEPSFYLVIENPCSPPEPET